jgi:exosortase/archaeosortase family protein
MKIYEFLNKQIKTYKPVSYYILFFICLFILIFFFKKYLYNHLAFLQITKYYYNFIIIISREIYNLIGYNSSQLKLESILSVSNEIAGKFLIKILFLRQTLIFLAIASLFPLNIFRKFRLLLMIFFSMQIFIIVRIVILSVTIQYSNHIAARVVSEMSILVMNMGLFFLFFYWFKTDFGLKKVLMDKLTIGKHVLKNLFLKAFFCIFILGIINISIRTGLFNLDYSLTYGIMKGSSLLLKIPGYISNINHYTITGGNSISIHMGYPCIGINLMFVFAAFIVFMKGRIIDKIWFISSGVLFIYFMNILRITFLFIYLEKTHKQDRLFVDVHDIYSYTVYFVIFLMWVLWIKKIQFFELKNKLVQNNEINNQN